MKAHKFIFFFTLLFATVCTYAQEITPSDTPNETQKAMLKRGYGMFIHFGVNYVFRETNGRTALSPSAPTTRPGWTATNGYGWPEMPVSAMFCSSPSITTGSACGTANIPTTMWLPHPSRRMWWVKYPKPAKNTVCNLPSIIHCGTATNPYTKGKILANTLTICRIN